MVLLNVSARDLQLFLFLQNSIWVLENYKHFYIILFFVLSTSLWPSFVFNLPEICYSNYKQQQQQQLYTFLLQLLLFMYIYTWCCLAFVYRARKQCFLFVLEISWMLYIIIFVYSTEKSTNEQYSYF
jgi:hypothetical protein